MTIHAVDVPAPTNPSLAKSLSCAEVSGGKETNPAWTSQVGNEQFSAALAASLRAAGYLADAPNARFRLSALVIDLDQPFIGFNMTVTSKIHYTLTDSTTGKVLLKEVMVAEHTATVGDAFVGVERLRLANEGSARKNITALINKLHALNVPTGALTM